MIFGFFGLYFLDESFSINTWIMVLLMIVTKEAAMGLDLLIVKQEPNF
ncbi:unnamed protein product [Acidithrix sp. C25]|nr:unnamed protein product [Acidithrix sp. C25]